MVREANKTGEPFVGMDLGSAEFELDQRALDDYFAGLELSRPSTGGAAPCMLANNADLSTRGGFSNGFGNLWLRQEWDFQRPLAVGATYVASAAIQDIYERRDRTVVLSETTLRDASGEVAVVQRHHQSFVLSQSSGEAVLRDPKKKEGARGFEVPAGDELPSIERAVSLEMCGQFFHGRKNYHTDKEASAELGFRDVVVGGKMTMSMVGEVLQGGLGSSWVNGGKLLVKFTNIVWPSETVRARAVRTGPLADEAGRDGVVAWVEKEDGTICIVAEGSVGG
jgi:hypothetical protein